jgi:hypothetical protein
MIKHISIHVITTLFIIWYWNNSDASSKDELFYFILIGLQVALFFFANEISKLTAELEKLKKGAEKQN